MVKKIARAEEKVSEETAVAGKAVAGAALLVVLVNLGGSTSCSKDPPVAKKRALSTTVAIVTAIHPRTTHD